MVWQLGSLPMKAMSIKMAVEIPTGDPAHSLWARADVTELEKFWDVLSAIPVRAGLIAERLGLDVISKTLPPDISGLIKRNDDGTFEIHVNNTDAPVRQRFTVCHEIAHFLLHKSHIDQEGITDNILYRSKLTNKQEAEANRLAAALLLPWGQVVDWHQQNFGCAPSPENVDGIAAAFKTSRLAAGYRFGF